MPGLEGILGSWPILVGVGGLLGLDATSWPQLMVSRPVVSATVGGALLGSPLEGLLVGGLLELLTLGQQPLGASRQPDTGPGGLVGGAGYVAAGGGDVGALVGAVAAAATVAWVGGYSVVGLRILNGRLLGPERRPRLASEPRRLERRHRLAMGLDLVRGALLTAVFAVPTILVARAAARAGGPALQGGLALALALSVGVAAGAGSRKLSSGRGQGALLAAGLGAGMALLLAGTA